jgi:hypothetical protein
VRLCTGLNIHRHPELVSGSTFPFTLGDRRQTKAHGQINPLRILGAYQVDFPRPMPVFQLLLASDRVIHRRKHLKMHKAIDCIFGRMPRYRAVTMLVKAFDQIRGQTNVKRAVRLACKNVNARLFFCLHQLGLAARWTLKQVQGDDKFQVRFHKPRHPELVSGSTGRFVQFWRFALKRAKK